MVGIRACFIYENPTGTVNKKVFIGALDCVPCLELF